MDSLNRGINSVNQKINLLTSYSHIYKSPNQKIELPTNRDKLMIDSGAYDLLIRGNLEEYPFTPKEYSKAIKCLEIKPNYVVSMDYICSREEKNNNEELIKKTIKNAEILRKEFKRDEDIIFLPVVQGYILNDYIFCLKELIARNIIENGDQIGVGSLVGRRNLKETRKIIIKISELLKKEDLNVGIHCFGLNISVLKNKEVFNLISSIDSLTWTFPYLFGRVKIFTRERIIEANSNGSLKEPEFYYLSLNSTLNYIEFLNLRFRNIDGGYFNDKDKLLIFNSENYEKFAQKLGITNFQDNKINSDDEFLKFLIKRNEKFPRENNLNISTIPVYTGHKFSILEPKNTNIGKCEFSYLFFNALNLSLQDFEKKKNTSLKNFKKQLENFYLQFNEDELNIIREIIKNLESDLNLNKALDIKEIIEDFDNFRLYISETIKELKLKLVELNSLSNQVDLNGKKIKNVYNLLI